MVSALQPYTVLQPYTDRPLTEFSVKDLVSTIAEEQQQAEAASDEKDAAFQTLIAKMAKSMATVLKENALLRKKSIEEASQHTESEKVLQGKIKALTETVSTQDGSITVLKKTVKDLQGQVASYQKPKPRGLHRYGL